MDKKISVEYVTTMVMIERRLKYSAVTKFSHLCYFVIGSNLYGW